jgi:hypothetical protein
MARAIKETHENAGGTRPEFCPSCERYIGPVSVCPYCDADAAVPRAMRVIKVSAVLLASAGLALLFVMSRSKDVPEVKVSELTPLMNFGSVQVSGTVSRNPFIGREKGEIDYISFLLDDGTGRVRVQVYGLTAKELSEAGMIPRQGQQLRAAGSLNVSGEGDVKLRLRSVGDLEPIAPGSEERGGK